jgi:LemA protein
MRASVLLLLVPVGLGAYGGYIYYRLLWLRLQSKRALQHVEDQLSGHHVTLPEFLHKMSEYVKHEAWVIDHVVEARCRLMMATTIEERMHASTHLSEVLHHLLQISKSCHELHANDEAALIHIQVELAEQKIALAREYYNHVVQHYNERIECFPHSVMAKVAGFRREAMFEFPFNPSRAYAGFEV